MVRRRPLVSISGSVGELPPGDVIEGGALGTLTAGSGLFGGGPLLTDTEIGFYLAPNASGLVLDAQPQPYLCTDGVVQVNAANALSSGNFSLAEGAAAAASGNAGLSLASAALASGNAALTNIAGLPTGVLEVFEANGAINTGSPVGFDESGGIQSIGVFTNKTKIDLSSLYLFSAGSNAATANVVYDSNNNKIVIVYRDTSTTYPTAVVGTVSGNSISYGTPVVIVSQSSTNTCAAFDSSSGQIFVAYSNTTGAKGSATMGTVSGTSISFGTIYDFITTDDPLYVDCAYDVANNKAVVIYRDRINTDIDLKVATISGTTISFGAAQSVSLGVAANFSCIIYDPTHSQLVFCYEVNSNNLGTVGVGSLSGSTFTRHTASTFGTNTSLLDLSYDSTADKFILTYEDGNLGRAIVVDTGASTINSISSAVSLFDNQVVVSPVSIHDAFYNTNIFVSRLNNEFVTQVATLSGTTLTTYPYTGAGFNGTVLVGGMCYDSTNNKSIAVGANADTSLGFSAILLAREEDAPTLNSLNNFIGIAQSTVSSGSSVEVRLPGSYDTNFTGLTPGALYYVDPTTSGFSSTVSSGTWSGAVNYSPVGRAVTSTTLLLTDSL